MQFQRNTFTQTRIREAAKKNGEKNDMEWDLKKIFIAFGVFVIVLCLVAGYFFYYSITHTYAHSQQEKLNVNTCTTPLPITGIPIPSLTPIPVATPSSLSTVMASGGGASPQPEGNNSTTNPPGNPTCTVSIEPPILQGFQKTSPTSIFWSWWASLTPGITNQWVEYWMDNGPHYTKIINPTDTGTEIGSLDATAKQNWAIICVQKDGCVACSNPLDP